LGPPSLGSDGAPGNSTTGRQMPEYHELPNFIPHRTGHKTRVAYSKPRTKLATHGLVGSALVSDLCITSTCFPLETGHKGQFYERIAWQTRRMQALTRNRQHASCGQFQWPTTTHA